MAVLIAYILFISIAPILKILNLEHLNTDWVTAQEIMVLTVLPAKSDRDFMFCLQSYQGLIIDRSLVYKSYPQDRINTQVIYQFAIAHVKCTRLSFT